MMPRDEGARGSRRHVTGAVILDPTDEATDEAIVNAGKVPPVLKSFDRRKPVIVYDDRENSDSAQLIAIKLRQFGFTNVRILEGREGYQSWRTKGYPVEATR
jgi:3-mercaptopyruvate sulfurtransferase SseA